MYNLANQLFSGRIPRMGLPRKNKLNRRLALRQQFHQPLRLPQQQRTSFVSGKSPRKSNRQHLWVQHFIGPFQLRMKRTAAIHLPFQAVACKHNHPLLAALVGSPELFIRNLIDGLPYRLIHNLISPAGTQIPLKKKIHLRTEPRLGMDAVGN